jgi:N-ethylmaleimide reductase
MTTRPLFSPFSLGRLSLPNRILMAPMTRNRADGDSVPGDLAVRYYAQRASAGLIITEGTQPSAHGKAYPGVPGIHSDEQQAGWARVTGAVHAAGGRIFLQLMHAGRASHPDNLPGGAKPVAPSAVTPTGQQVFTPTGMQDFVEPRALELDEIRGIQQEYADAARRAITAGFDGVELHAANGYLPQQFLAENSNLRTDAYGGSAQNRVRFVVETAQALVGALGADRVGLKISPASPWNDIGEQQPLDTYDALIRSVESLGLLYLHVAEPPSSAGFSALDFARERFSGPLIATSGFANSTMSAEIADRILSEGRADLVAFARLFVSNPDLPKRLRENAPLTEIDEATLYTPGPAGYTDYPYLDPSDEPSSALEAAAAP